jgi:hypothetical protein
MGCMNIENGYLLWGGVTGILRSSTDMALPKGKKTSSKSSHLSHTPFDASSTSGTHDTPSVVPAGNLDTERELGVREEQRGRQI